VVDSKKPCVAIIVQTRLGSTRLPGKVMMGVLGRPLLSFQLERLQHCRSAHKVIVATTTNPIDHKIVQYCEDQKISYFIGSEENVLERYYRAAQTFGADVVVRVTSDCPLIDPVIIDKVIDTFVVNSPEYDYVSNVERRTYARGMDVEVMSISCLERIYHQAVLSDEKEHVTLYLHRHPEKFKIGSVTSSEDTSRYRLTLDTLEDYKLIKLILEELYPFNKAFTLDDIIAGFKHHPDWEVINGHIKQSPIGES
jgi:spore coat polysaccharide biosynthesis protein SpsF